MVLKKDGGRAVALASPSFFFTHHRRDFSAHGRRTVAKVGDHSFVSPMKHLPPYNLVIPSTCHGLPGVPPPRLRRPPSSAENYSVVYIRLRATTEELTPLYARLVLSFRQSLFEEKHLRFHRQRLRRGI